MNRMHDENQGLFRDDGPVDPYGDDFDDEAAARPMAPSKAGVTRWKRWGLVLLFLGVVGGAVALGVSLGGGGGDNQKSANTAPNSPPSPPTSPPTIITVTNPTGAEPAVTMAPVASPQEEDFPTPAPTASEFPTFTGAPTRPVYWDEYTTPIRDSASDSELMGSALDISNDGSIVWIGAFNYTSGTLPPGVGRIRRLDTATGIVTDVYGVAQGDSLGYQVSGSGDGEFVAGFFSTENRITVWDYMTSLGQMRPYASAELPYEWDNFTVIFDFSKDGKWLAITGTEIINDGLSGDRLTWKLRIYQLVTGSGGQLQQFGADIDVQSDMDIQPTLFALDMSEDGSVVAVATVAVDDSQGLVRVFQRQGNAYVPLSNPAGDPALISTVAAGVDDFFARRIQVRVAGGIIWLAIGWESRDVVLMRRWDGTSWVEAGQIEPEREFEDDEDLEFGYDIDLSNDMTRLIVGVRCFNNCQGATQVFQLNTAGIWVGLGQVIVGYEATFFGEAVAISADGSIIAVGAPVECNDQDICGGAIYVYQYDGPEISDSAVITSAPVTPGMPTPAPVATPSPTPDTDWPTTTSAPTYAFGWEQIDGVFDSINEELFAAAVSLSGDGTVVYVGGFENGEFAESSGRIVRIDLANDNNELIIYGDAFDFLGFDVSSSLDGNRVVGYLSSSSVIEVADFTVQSGLQQSSALTTGFNSTSATFSLSKNGEWLVGIGIVDTDDGLGSPLTVKTYQVSGSSFVPFGTGDLVLETFDTAPTLDIHLIDDGSYMVVSLAGWNGFLGKVVVYQRSATGWTKVGQDLTSSITDDFYGKTVRLARTPDGLIRLFISAPYRNSVFVYQLSGSTWIPFGSIISAGEDFTADDEFGFDIDVSLDGSRVVIGVRCFDLCRGAVQVFEYTDNWYPLGQIIAGFSDSYFGEAVGCDSDCNVLAIGAPEDCGDEGCGGSVYIFEGVDNRT